MKKVLILICFCFLFMVSGCKKEDYIYEKKDGELFFGSYPQTEVTSTRKKKALDKLAGELPTSSSLANWKSYGYYDIEKGSCNMWYIDIDYNNDKYRGVYFTDYRVNYVNNNLNGSVSTLLIDDSYQENNGYTTSNVYWFEFEPIKWKILEEKNGEALLLCEMIVDSQIYYNGYETRTINDKNVYINNWEYSDIRKWLNETFYNTAFNELQKGIIMKQNLDNRTQAAGRTANRYAVEQNDTEDNVWLLSYLDVFNTKYGFEELYKTADSLKQKKGTSYAKSQGLCVPDGEGCNGESYWLLRTPFYGGSMALSGCHCLGVTSYYYAYCSCLGIAPAIRIKL